MEMAGRNVTVAALAGAGVTESFEGHDLCQDYPGGSTPWIFAPSVDLQAAFGGNSKDYAFTASQTCTILDKGCAVKSFTYGVLASGNGFAGTIAVNDVPHPTSAGQAAIASDVQAAIGGSG